MWWKEYWASFQKGAHRGREDRKLTLLETLHSAVKYLTGVRRGADGESGKEGFEHLWCDSQCVNVFLQIPKNLIWKI